MNNANELYNAMAMAIIFGHKRHSDDVMSPLRSMCYEAVPMTTFTLHNIANNVPTFRDVNKNWAIANVLHFFAATEDASMLHHYNKHASRFVKDGRLDGAYGKTMMPQLRECMRVLNVNRDTRRAIVTIGNLCDGQNANKPACWTSLQFLTYQGCLDLLVFQRSLHLTGVMPYDCILLTNILHYVCAQLRIPCGKLRWTVGSLHSVQIPEYTDDTKCGTLLLKPDILETPMQYLQNHEHPFWSRHGN